MPLICKISFFVFFVHSFIKRKLKNKVAHFACNTQLLLRFEKIDKLKLNATDLNFNFKLDAKECEE